VPFLFSTALLILFQKNCSIEHNSEKKLDYFFCSSICYLNIQGSGFYGEESLISL